MVIVAGVRKVGSVLPTVSVLLSVSDPLLVSVTVTEHSTTSFGPTVDGVSCNVLAVDANCVFVDKFVHVKDGVSV